MKIGVVGTGRIGAVHARNLAETDGVAEVCERSVAGRRPVRIGPTDPSSER